ncbi:DUF6270 domain-containing protein [Terrabacter aeriphilus]|uniref:DUF6270 domain-containing protein n=1 Tax=Terrabacter aeriphilus TaxID=515662 RepID=A0ABP9J759_9MICO
MTESAHQVGVLIYGSCVSRDTFAHLPDSFRIVHYVARQSAISVDAPARGVAEALPALASAFQDRVVRGDIRGDLLKVVSARVKDVDLVLVDLIDERGGVIAIGDGYVSKLAEFWGGGGREVAGNAKHIPFGSDEHFELWRAGMDRVVDGFAEVGLADKVLVLRTAWADHLDDGSPLEIPAWMTRPDIANAQYERYFAHLTARGLPVAQLPDDLARSTRSHKWGPSPFHYTDEAYGWLADTIAAHVVSR